MHVVECYARAVLFVCILCFFFFFCVFIVIVLVEPIEIEVDIYLKKFQCIICYEIDMLDYLWVIRYYLIVF